MAIFKLYKNCKKVSDVSVFKPNTLIAELIADNQSYAKVVTFGEVLSSCGFHVNYYRRNGKLIFMDIIEAENSSPEELYDMVAVRINDYDKTTVTPLSLKDFPRRGIAGDGGTLVYNVYIS